MNPYPKLSDSEKRILQNGRCPDCSCGDFLQGPEGGLCTNIKCANPDCGSLFNVGWFLDPSNFFGERISEPSPLRIEIQLACDQVQLLLHRLQKCQPHDPLKSFMISAAGKGEIEYQSGSIQFESFASLESLLSLPERASKA